MATGLSAAKAEDRAGILAAWRQLLDIAEDRSLPLPILIPHSGEAEWNVRYTPDEAREMAAIESALPCQMAGAPENDGRDYVLAGAIGPVTVRIVARAQKVAERKVIGKREVEDVEWVRRPAGEPQDAAEAEVAA